jgi:gamma-glutamylcyclotransferase (GGCT)/AIG2-like uncharacterized protein YtfP
MPAHYLAYGSNLHPHRLRERVPSARLVGTALLPGYRLRFCKRSVDGSAKCTVEAFESGHGVHGALYRIDAHERAALDRAEGLGCGYEEGREQVGSGGDRIEVFFYVATRDHVDGTLRPYHWYKQLVLAGARYHGFPADYIAALAGQPSADDPDAERRAANEKLVRRCMDASRSVD